MAYFSTLICSVSTSNPLFFLSLFFFVLTETSWGSWGTEQRGFHRSGKSCIPWEGFRALKQEPHCFSPCSFVGSLVCSGKLKAGSQVSSQPLRTVCVALVQTGVHNWNLAELLKDFSKLTQSQLRGKSFLCSFYVTGLEEWDWCVFLSYEWLHSCFCTATVLVHCRGRVYYLRWWLSFIFQELLPRENCLLMPKKKLVPVSSFPVLCAHIVQIWWFIGWAVCGPFLQQQDGGQGGMWFCLFCRMILSGVVRTFFLNCCRIRGRVVWWWEMRSSHIDHALQIQYGDRLDV